MCNEKLMMPKKYRLISAILLVMVLLGGQARAGDEDDVLITRVLAVFKEKCFSCHSPEAKLGDPEAKKGVKKFSYIDDLQRLHDNPKLIVPGNPDKSVLYKEITKDEMPPEDSDVKPLSAPQKQSVKQWILGGAPGKSAPRPPRTFMARLIEFIGKFHPLAAHTPIAVLMAAAIAEAIYLRHPAPALATTARFCAVLGALGAIVTAVLGWAMATAPSIAKGNDLELHRWVGTIAGIASIPIAIVGEWGARRAHREGRKWHGFSRWTFRLSVFGIAAFVGYTAHLGGMLVWPDLFTFPK